MRDAIENRFQGGRGVFRLLGREWDNGVGDFKPFSQCWRKADQRQGDFSWVLGECLANMVVKERGHAGHNLEWQDNSVALGTCRVDLVPEDLGQVVGSREEEGIG